MKISIVTVVLNDAPGLVETADSIAKQSINNYEWIVVDGDSQDDGLELIRAMPLLKPVIVSKVDGGIYHAMNTGIELSKNEYLIFMNAGDTFSNEFVLADILRFIECAPSVDIILGGTCKRINQCVLYAPPRNINWIKHGLPAFHQSIVYRSSLMRSQKYNLSFKLLADYEWLARRCMDGVVVGYMNKSISVYSVGGASYTRVIQKFKDLYRVKYHVLGASILSSITGSTIAVLKTVVMMQLLYRLCNWFVLSSVKDTIDKENDCKTEYYKHGI